MNPRERPCSDGGRPFPRRGCRGGSKRVKRIAFFGFIVACSWGLGQVAAQTQPAWWKPAPNLLFQALAEDAGEYLAQLKPRTQIVVIEGVKDDYGKLKAQIQALHAKRVHVVCYHSLGWEKWRPDIAQFPNQAIGKDMEDWPDERWADTRPDSPANAFWDRRYTNFAAAGCDCVEDDNSVDPQKNASGFPLTRAEAAASAARRADKAHHLGMCHIAKNNPTMSAEFAKTSDGVHIEEAGQYKERESYLPWKQAGKYAVMIEYKRRYCRPYEGFTVVFHPSEDYFHSKGAVYCE